MKANGLEVIGVSSEGKELQEVRADEGIEVIPLEMTRTISPLKDLKSLWQFYWLCKQEKPQIVHSHTPKAGIIGMLGAKLAGVPFRLHTVAGMPLMEAKGLKRMVLDWVEKLTYACATKIYPNSKGLYDFIVQQKYTSVNKLKVIGNGSSNGIDTAYFSKSEELEKEALKLRQGYGIKEDDFVFVFVGRLVGDKGVNELVSAFVKLQQSTASQVHQPSSSPINRFTGSQVHRFTGSQVHRFTGSQAHKFTGSLKLLLVGALESDLDPLSSETLQEIERNPDIIAAGFQKDVRPFFVMSDALVFPSYREGFPNVVMQAGAMDLPAIVSDINGCNEIIEEGVNGLIIP
ncbi:glycosyltransferase family 1 protein, partial [Pseudoxanthomonas sp. SGD-10]